MVALIFVFLNTHCNEEVNSICILLPVPEFLLVNSAARRFLMAAGFEGNIFIQISLLVDAFIDHIWLCRYI